MPAQSAVNIPREPIDLDAEGYSAKRFVHRRDKTPPMRLKIVEDDDRGNTHKLKSQEHFWEGTEAQFRESFDPAESEDKKEAAKADDEAKKAIEEARKASAEAKKAEEAAAKAKK